ncbi:MAG: hypothetical protein NDI61_09545 [Bdellovibrionaceae bacterium]|nr:hypothetical protein [Pseudobdellovibrionaceae bacterium]
MRTSLPSAIHIANAGVIHFVKVALVGLVLSAALSVYASEKMDFETHTLLITKLERVLENSTGNGSDADSLEVRLRLADLLAERARLSIVAAEGKDSAAVTRDRRRALQIYSSAVEKSEAPRRALVLMQMAHLLEATGEIKKALQKYERIVREGTETYPAASVGHALASWGDALFRKGEFTAALDKFESSLKFKETERRGYIMYRAAWCRLNLGQQTIATQGLIEILRHPELLTRKTANGSEIDVSFREDIARDLVAFIARGEVSREKVDLLLELTPESIRRENLRALAGETERLGKKKESIFVWSMILNDETSTFEKIDGRVRLATLEWGLNRKAQAVEQLTAALATWKKEGCRPSEECQAVQSRIRKLIVDWNRLEKERVSPELLAAYTLYNQQFETEYDMQFWAAQTARLLNKYNEASEFYRRSSILAHRELKKKEDSAIQKMFEAALVAQIEMAESGGDPSLQLKAYDHYLDLNAAGGRALEVRYQRARVFYDQNRHEKAAEEFRDIALFNEKKNSDAKRNELRKKAADLALDALVLAKAEDRIERWATEFAETFPSARLEYLAIARRAVLKDVATVSRDAKSSDSELKRAARRLRDLNLDGASATERALIYKNHLVLAVRIRDLEETRAAADRLLGVSGLQAEDREFAMEKKVWVAEMRLEFDSAYRMSQVMRMPKASEAERHMRLAYLAELAGRNPTRHYQAVLETSRAKSTLELAATRLVRLSARPWKELARLERYLKGNRDLHSSLVLELYARTGSRSNAELYLSRGTVRSSDAGQTISRSIQLQAINRFDQEISAHRLITSSDARVQRTLKARLALLAKADQLAQDAIRSKDWRLQVVTLSIVGRENERLYNEIKKLPVPVRLSVAERARYEQALAAQSAPFQAKAEQVSRKTAEFWNNGKALDSLIADLQASTGDVTRVLAEEARQLAYRAPDSTRARLERAIREAMDRPSATDVKNARHKLKSDPFSIHQAKMLKTMEAELGRDAMVAHLDARVLQIEGGVK